MEPLVKEDEHKAVLVYGTAPNGAKVEIAVEGIYYVLSPENNKNCFLSADSTGLLTLERNEVNPQNYFIFSKTVVKSGKSKTDKGMEAHGKKPIIMVPDAENPSVIRLAFKDDPHDKEAWALRSLADHKVIIGAPEEGDCDVWLLQPAFNMSTIQKVDAKTRLFKIQKDLLCASREAIPPVTALLELLKSQRVQKVDHLRLVGQQENYLYFTTHDSEYSKGIYISGDCALKIFSINEGAEIGEGKSFQEASEHKVRATRAIDVKDLSLGNIIFIKPPLDKPFPLGDIRVAVANSSIWSCWSRSTHGKPYSISRIYEDGNIESPDGVLEFDDNIIFFIYTNRLNPGMVSYLAERKIKNAQQAMSTVIDEGRSAGEQLLVRFDDTVAKFGTDIVKASRNINEAVLGASNAMVESTKEASASMRFVAVSLNSTIIHAATVFNNAIVLLSETGNKVSVDMKENVNMLTDEAANLGKTLNEISRRVIDGAERIAAQAGQDAKDITKQVGNDAKDITKQIGKDAKEIAGTIAETAKEATRNFNVAFKELASAMEGSSKNIGNSIKDASSKFVQGVEQLKAAAESLKNINVDVNTYSKVDLCTIA